MNAVRELLRSGHLRAVDHALALTLQRLLPETPDAVALAAALASCAISQGHSRLPLAGVAAFLAELAPDREVPVLPSLQEWQDVLRASPWVNADASDKAAVLVLEDGAIALRRYWHYEVRLANAILARRLSTLADTTEATAANDALEARLQQLFPDVGDRRQADAARAALTQRFLLLTGGPGTGKTTTVARTLVLFTENFACSDAGMMKTATSSSDPVAISIAPAQVAVPRILLAAPTGKAAARLAESVRENLAGFVRDGLIADTLAQMLPGTASTLHRLLGWQRGSIDFRHHAGNPLPADLVIVDEASMIDLPLMCKLLETISPETTLVLIGDRDQLPSVETGDVLAALCDAADAAMASTHVATAGCDEDAGTTCLALAGAAATPLLRVHLTHTHRQRDDIDVAALAALVRDGEADTVLSGLAAERFRGVRWQRGGDRALADAVLMAALPVFRGVAAAADVSTALLMAKQFRVLTAVREGMAGSQTLNALIAGALNPEHRSEDFFHGRLVLVTENSYRHGLFNGDIGIAWRDATGLRVWFEAVGGPRAWLPATLPAHESAFALTVHKSQGSEFDEVLLVLPERDSRVLSRELLYTGLTRCRRGLGLWAGETALREAIGRRAQRWSGLAGKLRVAGR